MVWDQIVWTRWCGTRWFGPDRPILRAQLSQLRCGPSPSIHPDPPLPTMQAGQLEKALEIMVWVQCAGVQFDQTTYEELIAVTEIAEV